MEGEKKSAINMPEEDEENLESLSLTKLRKYAKEHGIEDADEKTKAESELSKALADVDIKSAIKTRISAILRDFVTLL